MDTKEGSTKAPTRPRGFGFTSAEAKVLLAPGGFHCTSSRGGCRGGGASDEGSWSSTLSTIASTACTPAGGFGPVSWGLQVLLYAFHGEGGAKKLA